MGLIDVGGIIVAVVAALGAWAAQRAAAKASRVNAVVSSRLDAEKGAYERARAFDVETIKHQNEEIASLRLDNARLRKELAWVKERLARLEDISPSLERLLRERIEESDANDS